jgi:hypothetical protein
MNISGFGKGFMCQILVSKEFDILIGAGVQIIFFRRKLEVIGR